MTNNLLSSDELWKFSWAYLSMSVSVIIKNNSEMWKSALVQWFLNLLKWSWVSSPALSKNQSFVLKDYFDQITITNYNYLGRFRKYFDHIQNRRCNLNFQSDYIDVHHLSILVTSDDKGRHEPQHTMSFCLKWS